MSPTVRRKGTWGQLVDLVPSVRISILDAIGDEVEAWIAKAIAASSAATVHGARMAGQVLAFPDEDGQRGQWVLVGMEPDGRNCEDCLDLHGTEMAYGEFLDTKYTTRCGGNCRCGFAASAAKGERIDPLMLDEITAALDA